MSAFGQIIICLILSAFFSGMEMAFFSANRLRIELDRRQGIFSSRIVSFFIKHPERYLATILIGNNVVLVIYSLIVAELLGPFLQTYIMGSVSILLIQTVLSTLLIIFAAEFIPKLIFRNRANFFLNYFSPPVLVLYYLLYPVVQFIIWLSGIFLSKDKNDGASHEKYLFGRVDLEHFIEDVPSNSDDLDTPQEIKIFRNALDFSKVRLRDCMVPRTDLVAVEDSEALEKLKEKFIETGFSKILVYHQSIDNIIGYINLKDLFKNSSNWQTKIVKAPFAPETMLASNMLRTLLQEHKSLAIVVDEFGGTAGIVTIEDLIEEIFGEIEDEHDTREAVEKVMSDNGYIFSGRLNVQYLNEKYNLNIPLSDEYETLAGYVMQKIGKIPSNNETFEIDNFSIRILKIIRNRIDLVYLKVEKE
jgi:CBS domain containing-hemolysin-like protein